MMTMGMISTTRTTKTSSLEQEDSLLYEIEALAGNPCTHLRRLNLLRRAVNLLQPLGLRTSAWKWFLPSFLGESVDRFTS